MAQTQSLTLSGNISTCGFARKVNIGRWILKVMFPGLRILLQYALILEASEDGEITVNVTSRDSDGLHEHCANLLQQN